MKDIKECIRHALEGVKPQPESVLEMLGERADKAVKLAEMTAQPLSFPRDSRSKEDVIRDIIYKVQYDVLSRLNSAYKEYFMYRDLNTNPSATEDKNSLIIECVDFDRNLWKAKFNTDVYKNGSRNSSSYIKVTTITKAQTRAGKISTLIKWAYDVLDKEPKVSKYVGCPITDAVVNDTQKRVADLRAQVESGTLAWLYFVNTDYKSHYLQLREAQNLQSCMAYPASYFGTVALDPEQGFVGKTDTGDNVHPLDGYDYAPHFALGLLSKHSPDELQAMLDEDDPSYPFDARVVITFDSYYNKLAYSRVYGAENSRRILNNVLKRIDKPIGALLFGNAIGGYTNSCELGSTDETSFRRIQSNLCDHFMMSAPFVDTWANHYEPFGKVFKHPSTGRYVQLLEVNEANRCDEICLASFHGNGLLRAIDTNEDCYSATVNMDGQWVAADEYNIHGEGDNDDNDW